MLSDSEFREEPAGSVAYASVAYASVAYASVAYASGVAMGHLGYWGIGYWVLGIGGSRPLQNFGAWSQYSSSSIERCRNLSCKYNKLTCLDSRSENVLPIICIVKDQRNLVYSRLYHVIGCPWSRDESLTHLAPSSKGLATPLPTPTR